MAVGELGGEGGVGVGEGDITTRVRGEMGSCRRFRTAREEVRVRVIEMEEEGS